jgi:xylulokinase
MRLVAGVDCSTQATKVLVCDAETGAVVRSGRAAHPDQTEVDPAVWWAAWQEASNGLLDDVAALAVGGQQHGMVLVDDSGAPVRDALLWNDNRSAAQAQHLIRELGGPSVWASAVGSVPVASFTVTKLRWVAEHEPEIGRRATGVALPHDWLTYRLIDGAPEFVTDRGDASGTGYWSPATDDYRHDLLRRAFGADLEVPRVAGTHEPLGHTAAGAVVAPGTGDNMAAALGLGLRPGDLAVSLGTSGTVFAVTDRPTADESGIVAGFADASGAYLPLVCTLNAARVLTAAASIAGVDLDELDALAASVDDTDGLVLLPYLDGERTPPLPEATGVLHGLTRRNATRAHLARAAVEGMLCGLADAVDALRTHGVEPRRAVLIGGAARAGSVQRIAAELFGLEVSVPEPGEYVALGAARQAAWTLAESDAPPDWPITASRVAPEADRIAAGKRALSRYRETLAAAGPLLGR